jgi:hypothetical protein
MADKKISQLTPSALPLAGTEVLPIVQSGSTVKVASNDLTVKNFRSNATTGILQVAGPAAGATRTMTTPDANFTVARTDASNSFTGDQTLATGNLVIGTSGKGIDFSATGQAAGMTSELLSDYEEGTFTPTISSGITSVGYATQNGSYTKVGRLVTFSLRLELNAGTAAAAIVRISGLPFTSDVAFRGYAASYAYIYSSIVNSTSTNPPTLSIDAGATIISFYNTAGAAFNGTDLNNAAGFGVDLCGMYYA